MQFAQGFLWGFLSGSLVWAILDRRTRRVWRQLFEALKETGMLPTDDPSRKV